MSISERERQALDSIEGELARSAPQLTSMLAMFSRLTAGEQMPVREPVRSVASQPGRAAATAGRAGRRQVLWCHIHIGRAARGWLFLVAAAVLLTLMVTFTHGTRVSACAHSMTTACQQAHSVFPAGHRGSGGG